MSDTSETSSSTMTNNDIASGKSSLMFRGPLIPYLYALYKLPQAYTFYTSCYGVSPSLICLFSTPPNFHL